MLSAYENKHPISVAIDAGFKRRRRKPRAKWHCERCMQRTDWRRKCEDCDRIVCRSCCDLERDETGSHWDIAHNGSLMLVLKRHEHAHCVECKGLA